MEAVTHREDPIDQLSVLAGAVCGLAALDISDTNLSLLHPPGLILGPDPFDRRAVWVVASGVVGPALAVEAALLPTQGSLVLFDLRAKRLKKSHLRSDHGNGRGSFIQTNPTDTEFVLLFVIGPAPVDQLNHKAVAALVFAPDNPGKLDRTGQPMSNDQVIGWNDHFQVQTPPLDVVGSPADAGLVALGFNGVKLAIALEARPAPFTQEMGIGGPVGPGG